MNIGQALFLGVVQGVTEFLPVSSSGHLGLFEAWLTLDQPSLFFNVFLHAASLIAIVVFFWQHILRLKIRDWWLLGVGTIPAAIAGFLFENTIESATRAPLIIGVLLMITGLINLFSQRKLDQPVKESITLSETSVFKIGIFQAFALLPGISRSGSTLLGGLSQGLSKENAFSFTFLLGIPAIIGANLLQIMQLVTEQQPTPSWLILLAGGVAAFAASFLSLGLLKRFIQQAKLIVFSRYCFVLGAGVVVSQFIL